MKEHLDQNSRNAVVTYRLQKCEQAMNEAALLAEGGCYDCAVTRLYYACFYIACALLISNGLECGTHAGVKRMLSLHFIASGTIDRKYMRTYSNLMQGRQLSDYEDFIYQDEDSYSAYLKEAQEFQAALRPHILMPD